MSNDKQVVILKKQAPFAWIVLNRPESANALNRSVLNGLVEICADLACDPSIYAIGIIGSGSKIFSAGADLIERKTMKDVEVVDYHDLIQRAFLAIENLPQITIACLNGSAYGGGVELALVCDLRVMSAEAILRLTETRLGIIPGAGGTQRLPRLIGKSRAKEIIYFTRAITAKEAYNWGLVHKVIENVKTANPDGENEHMFNEVQAWAKDMLNAAPLSLKEAKIAIDRGIDQDIASGLVLETESYLRLLHTKDRIEALQAFQEKRQPVFRGE